MKKLFYFLTLALLTGFITSCSNDDDIYEIELSGVGANNSIELVENGSAEITVKQGNGNYVVSSSDKTIATAVVEGNIVKITGLKVGTTIITISDNHKSIAVNVTITINDDTVIIEDSAAPTIIQSSGFYVVNEDWFGHDNGTVNYFKNDGSIIYRAYRVANPDDKLGVTTQFATIYGNYVYFVSKQGSKLIVADAKTLKKKAELTDIGGDGRSFIGVNTTTGYIGTLKGITTFNIANLTTGAAIEGISGQVGNMCMVGNYVFAVVQSKGVYIINTKTNTVEKTIEGSYNTLTQSKDGNVWIGAGTKLIQINPYNFETTNIDLTGTQIGSSWGAWNAGGLCASTQQNVLYWTYSGKVTKYDIGTKTCNSEFYTLGKDDADKALGFYGAGLRVDPLSDKLILNVKRSGWGDAGSYNWVHVVSNTGTLEKNIIVAGDNGLGSEWGTANDRYFWFPAMPFFEDANEPAILVKQIIVKTNERKAICLSDKIVDADNMSTAIVKTVTFPESELFQWEMKQDSIVITAGATKGKAKFVLQANSNGKITEKEVRIDVR